ncbi:GTPase HflX [candidate division WOR-1 bacterium RIFOXYA2_FULL_36_21]|uniref:GTPase HflX n=1 Tax=candidate division WOR-1 bacterium RIFOXYB2_FULL_36_35 TaxID=1802578 RepID=A0A1F4S5V3_UNCSA|nr:MAG: GTPase HflX [candidate division WOR-1 bacterium RIFOXYA2_FULL_36_21]OGC15818.1 MAG: GTPase HflX [candidate division WOR-1 bacterium RIFOXYB2_FULL_36_35]OGC15920.1 MAG: GTPase HflX [candidate division WOR-1 bacterium RIFOXYA12_FULL_36_13]
MEKALLVEVKIKSEEIPLKESLQELEQLVKSAGAQIVGTLTQQKEAPDLRFFIGKGKANELKDLCQTSNANVIIFNNDLLPSQSRNLEDFLGIKVINRTELILDIFAQHAHTREGKLQVELAQNEYLLTHLTGHGVELSRLGGGIGTRGPGETKLEIDRRKINKIIANLKEELEKVRKTREIARQKRKSSNLPLISIIGYTNAGKSTLLNSLAKANVLTQDKLFATLDPVTRRLYLPSGKIVLITDTVGFIRKLPHTLISAFRATLEETVQSDMLLHVVDASSPYMEDQINAVYNVLEELKIFSKPIITVFNKIDKETNKKQLEKLEQKFHPSTLISALNKEGLNSLLKILDQEFNPDYDNRG